MDSRKAYGKRSVIRDFLNKNPDITVNIFYLAGIFLFFIAIVVFMLINYSSFPRWFLEDTPDCYIERMTGIYCPGCGLSRSVIAFCQFKFVKSFVAHPVIIYSFFGYMCLMVKETVFRIYDKQAVTQKQFLYFVYGGIAVTIIQWIIKLFFAIII